MVVEAARADCAPPDGGPPLCLSGTVTAPDFSVALVEQPDKPGETRLQQGDTIDNWEVGEIGPRYVVLKQDDQEVRLAVGGAITQPAAAPPPPAPPKSVAERRGPMRHPRALPPRGEHPPDRDNK
jgi:hypothetical protein